MSVHRGRTARDRYESENKKYPVAIVPFKRLVCTLPVPLKIGFGPLKAVRIARQHLSINRKHSTLTTVLFKYGRKPCNLYTWFSHRCDWTGRVSGLVLVINSRTLLRLKIQVFDYLQSEKNSFESTCSRTVRIVLSMPVEFVFESDSVRACQEITVEKSFYL